jgi:hypothetical protein
MKIEARQPQRRFTIRRAYQKHPSYGGRGPTSRQYLSGKGIARMIARLRGYEQQAINDGRMVQAGKYHSALMKFTDTVREKLVAQGREDLIPLLYKMAGQGA